MKSGRLRKHLLMRSFASCRARMVSKSIFRLKPESHDMPKWAEKVSQEALRSVTFPCDCALESIPARNLCNGCLLDSKLGIHHGYIGYLRIPPRNGNFKAQIFFRKRWIWGVPPCHHAWLRRLSSRKGDVGDCAASARQNGSDYKPWLGILRVPYQHPVQALVLQHEIYPLVN